MKSLPSVRTSLWNNAVALVDHPSDAPPTHTPMSRTSMDHHE